MRIKKIFLSYLLSCLPIIMTAQNLNVIEFKTELLSLSASTNSVLDEKGDACSLLKVICLDKNLTFKGSIVGKPENKNNEYWIYLSPGSTSVVITKGADEYMVTFADYGVATLESKRTYSLLVKSESAQSYFDATLSKAESGDDIAQCELGLIYFLGRGHDIDYSKAVHWFMASANQGNSEAQYRLGLCYERGYSVIKSKDIARIWYTKAADNGHVAAQKKIEQK